MAAAHQDAAQTGGVLQGKAQSLQDVVPLLIMLGFLAMQIGTVSWFAALAAIELALTHPAVKKVSLISAIAAFLAHGTL